MNLLIPFVVISMQESVFFGAKSTSQSFQSIDFLICLFEFLFGANNTEEKIN